MARATAGVGHAAGDEELRHLRLRTGRSPGKLVGVVLLARRDVHERHERLAKVPAHDQVPLRQHSVHRHEREAVDGDVALRDVDGGACVDHNAHHGFAHLQARSDRRGEVPEQSRRI